MAAKHWHEYAVAAGGRPVKRERDADPSADAVSTPTRARHWHEYAEIAGGPPARKRADRVDNSLAAQAAESDATGPRVRHVHDYAAIAGGPPVWEKKLAACGCEPGSGPVLPMDAEGKRPLARQPQEFAAVAGGPPSWRKPRRKGEACECDPSIAVPPAPQRAKFKSTAGEDGVAFRLPGAKPFSRSQARWLSPTGTFSVPRSGGTASVKRSRRAATSARLGSANRTPGLTAPRNQSSAIRGRISSEVWRPPGENVPGGKPASMALNARTPNGNPIPVIPSIVIGDLRELKNENVRPGKGLPPLKPKDGPLPPSETPPLAGVWGESDSFLPAKGLLAEPQKFPSNPPASPPAVPLPLGDFVVHPGTQRLRIATFNTHLVPATGYDGLGALLPSNWGSYGTETYATEIASQILKRKEDFDVIAFNELFDADAQAILIRHLAKNGFPYWFTHICWTYMGLPTTNEDSGLAIFSRFPFVPLDARSTRPFVADSSHGGTSNLAFERYEPPLCEEGDCWADKGIALVRIEHGARKYNIAFTHLQADYPADGETFPAVRLGQLATIRNLLMSFVPSALADKNQEIVVVGDLNIEGWIGLPKYKGSTAAQPNPAMFNSEYVQGIWGRLGDQSGYLPFYDAWRTTSPEDEGQTHRYPRSEIGRLDYALLYGGGYYQAGDTSLSEAAFMSDELHDRQCPQWIRRTLQAAPSDHVGVLLELGPRGFACRPDFATKVTYPPDDSDYVDIVSIAQPGQVKWYRVDSPGTYSIGLLTRPGIGPDIGDALTVDVFPVADLSTPIGSISGLGTRVLQPAFACKSKGIPGCRFATQTYFPGESPFYVRVSSPSGRVTGDTAIYIRRHACSSEEDGCWLTPGYPLKEFGLNSRQGTFYFPFRTHAAFDGKEQTFEVEAASAEAMYVTVSSKNRGDLVVDARQRHFKRLYGEQKDDEYLLRVRRTPATPVRVGWRTDLTYLFGATDAYPSTSEGGAAPLSLYCADETDGDALGNDEILFEAGNGVGATKKVFFRAFWPDVNAGDPLLYPNMPPLPVVGPAKIWISELVGESMSTSVSDMDDTIELTIPPLDWNVPEHLTQTIRTSLHGVAPDGSVNPYNFYGAYEVTFNQTHSLGGKNP